jgi:hypothetical protein
MFRALLAHPQEALYKLHLVYCVRVMSVGCYQNWSGKESIHLAEIENCALLGHYAASFGDFLPTFRILGP